MASRKMSEDEKDLEFIRKMAEVRSHIQSQIEETNKRISEIQEVVKRSKDSNEKNSGGSQKIHFSSLSVNASENSDDEENSGEPHDQIIQKPPTKLSDETDILIPARKKQLRNSVMVEEEAKNEHSEMMVQKVPSHTISKKPK